MKRKVMVVADNMANLAMTGNLLEPSYEVYPASSAVKMFEILGEKPPDLILLDIEGLDIDDHEVVTKLKSDRRFAAIPVIVVTEHSDGAREQKGFESGVADYINRPFSTPLLLRRIEHQLGFIRQRKVTRFSVNRLSTKMSEKITEVLSLQNEIISIIAELVEFRDRFTGGHITRTQLYLKTILDGLAESGLYSDKISGWDVGNVLLSAQLHDVGKIAIPDIILNKPSRLTKEEFAIMKTHVTVGIDAVNKIISETKNHDFLRHTLYIIGAHHEKWDGTGYPYGLKDEDIPLEGRLMAVADVYDALVSWRPYKEKMTHEQAREVIQEGSGTHFDPLLVNAFFRVEDKFRRIASRIERDECAKWTMMTLTKDMELGVPEIDAQHRELIDRLNDFISFGPISVSREEIHKALDFLGGYIVRHFSDEEALQKQSDYPKYELHKNQHRNLIGKYQELKQEFADRGFSIELVVELGNSLINWVVNHIESSDVEFGKYYQIRNAVREEEENVKLENENFQVESVSE